MLYREIWKYIEECGNRLKQIETPWGNNSHVEVYQPREGLSRYPQQNPGRNQHFRIFSIVSREWLQEPSKHLMHPQRH